MSAEYVNQLGIEGPSTQVAKFDDRHILRLTKGGAGQ